MTLPKLRFSEVYLISRISREGGRKSLAQLLSLTDTGLRQHGRMSFLTHEMCLFAHSLCVLLRAKEEYRLSLKLPKDSREQGHSCTSLAVLRLPPRESSLLFLPPCTGSENHAVRPLSARTSDRLAQSPCLKHSSNTGAAQQPRSRFLGEVVIHLSSRYRSVPSSMSLACRHLFSHL